MVIQEMMQNKQIQDEKTPSEAESNPENVLAKGYGLSTGLAGQPNIFMLDARRAGFGDFDVVIKGASRATIEYLEEEEALYKIKYHVALPGDYLIEIKYDQLHIPGSPFTAQVMDPVLREERSFRKESGSQTNTSLESFSSSNDVSEDDTNNLLRCLEALVIAPSGKTLKGQIVTKYNGELSVKFPREEIGTYVISILNVKTRQPVGNSPYKVVVEKQKHKTTLTARGKGLKSAVMKETNCFTLSGANEVTLSNVCIAGVGRGTMMLRVVQNHADTIDVLYDIKQSGNYLFYIREHGEDILSSPFEVKSFDKSEKGKENLLIMSVAVWFGFDVNNAAMETTLTTPAGKPISHTIVRRGRHLLDIRFLPTMNGEYVLNISFNDKASEKQTFKIPVKNYRSSEEIFQISGEGLQNACTNVPAKVFIESKLPVSRSFSAEFGGPDKVDITQSITKEGKVCVTYVVNRPGCYIMSLKYDGFHIGASPYHIAVSNGERSVADRNSIASFYQSCHAYGDGLAHAVVGKPTHFTVDALNAGSGALMAGFEGSSLTEVVCKHIGNCIYEIHYKVMEVGVHKMNIFWAGQHITGSPFTIEIQDENNNS